MHVEGSKPCSFALLHAHKSNLNGFSTFMQCRQYRIHNRSDGFPVTAFLMHGYMAEQHVQLNMILPTYIQSNVLQSD